MLQNIRKLHAKYIDSYDDTGLIMSIKQEQELKQQARINELEAEQLSNRLRDEYRNFGKLVDEPEIPFPAKPSGRPGEVLILYKDKPTYIDSKKYSIFKWEAEQKYKKHLQKQLNKYFKEHENELL